MYLKKHLLILIILTGTALKTFAFEGFLRYHVATPYESYDYIFWVKDDLVRIDKEDEKGEISYSYLVDISRQEVMIVNESRKCYKEQKREGADYNRKGKLIRTGNFKVLNGVKCFQWRSRFEQEAFEITFWLSKGDFEIVREAIRMIGFSEKAFKIFAQYSPSGKYLPFYWKSEHNFVTKK